jgi:mRNA interferase RelE/StbE
MYEIVLTRDARTAYERADVVLVRKLDRCFENLSGSPYSHPNIKRLTGALQGHWRYRVGDWRVVYRLDEDRKYVLVVLIAHRGRAYL